MLIGQRGNHVLRIRVNLLSRSPKFILTTHSGIFFSFLRWSKLFMPPDLTKGNGYPEPPSYRTKAGYLKCQARKCCSIMFALLLMQATITNTTNPKSTKTLKAVQTFGEAIIFVYKLSALEASFVTINSVGLLQTCSFVKLIQVMQQCSLCKLYLNFVPGHFYLLNCV